MASQFGHACWIPSVTTCKCPKNRLARPVWQTKFCFISRVANLYITCITTTQQMHAIDQCFYNIKVWTHCVDLILFIVQTIESTDVQEPFLCTSA